LILSYGDLEYSKEIEKYANEIFPGKVEIIRDYMTSIEYMNYINTVDVCILDYKEQIALGNYYILLYLGKKIFLNDKGILKLSARLEGAQTYNVNSINTMSYDEFVEPITNVAGNRNFGEFYLNENTCVNMWVNTIKELV